MWLTSVAVDSDLIAAAPSPGMLTCPELIRLVVLRKKDDSKNQKDLREGMLVVMCFARNGYYKANSHQHLF